MLAFGHYLIDSSFNAPSLHTPAGKRASNEARHCFKSIICAAYAAITHCTALISKYKIRKSNKRSAGSNGRPWYPIWITRVPRILETSLGRCRWSFDRFSSPRSIKAWIVHGEKGIRENRGWMKRARIIDLVLETLKFSSFGFRSDWYCKKLSLQEICIGWMRLKKKKINFEIESNFQRRFQRFMMSHLMAKMTQPEKQVFPVIASRKFSTQYPRIIKITKTILYEYYISHE